MSGMQDFPLSLLAGLERQLVVCLQAVHRVPLDVRGWNEWRIVEHELQRAVRCIGELRRMAAWLRVGLPFGATRAVDSLAGVRPSASWPPKTRAPFRHRERSR